MSFRWYGYGFSGLVINLDEVGNDGCLGCRLSCDVGAGVRGEVCIHTKQTYSDGGMVG